MSLLVRVERHPSGPRLHVLGVRVHHWHAGAALIALGAALIVDDRRDLPGRTAPALPLPLFDPVIGVTTSHGVW